MRRRIEFEGLLQHNGFAIGWLGGCEADEDILGEGDLDASPERTLEGKKETWNNGS